MKVRYAVDRDIDSMLNMFMLMFKSQVTGHLLRQLYKVWDLEIKLGLINFFALSTLVLELKSKYDL